MANYFSERDKQMTKRLHALREQLPVFCEDFFVGIEPQTSTLSRLNYAYDLNIFFDYLLKNVRAFKDYEDIREFTVEDLNKVTLGNLEAFMEYLSFFEYGGREHTNGEKGKARKISTVRTFFKYFFNHDRIPSNVSAKLTMPKQHDKDIIRLEKREVERILDVAETGDGMSEHQKKVQRNTRGARFWPLVSLLLGTGIRVSECVGLNVKDIGFENQRLHRHPKRQKSSHFVFRRRSCKRAERLYLPREKKIDRAQREIGRPLNETRCFCPCKAKDFACVRLKTS